MPISRCSRTHVFVNNCFINERVRMLKSKCNLKKLQPYSTDIYVKTKLEYYSERPIEIESII